VKRSSVLHLGPDRLRAGPWRGDARTAIVAPVVPGSSPGEDAVVAAIARMRAAGYRRVITSALNPSEQEGFRAAGFTVHEHLHLLAHRLGHAPRADEPAGSTSPPQRASNQGRQDLGNSPVTIRRARRRDRAVVLQIDQQAFDGFWRFDADGLR
jgi:hypothetical protein